MSHTYVTLQVPPQFYNYVRKKLKEAGYDHAIDDQLKHIDMHGLALCIGKEEIKKKP